MAIPTTSWIETTPADTSQRYAGETYIRELKTQIRELFSVEHIMLSSGSGDTWGLHNKTELIPLTSNPEPVENSIILFQKIVNAIPELFFMDENSNYMQLTSNGGFVGGIVGEVRIYNGLSSAIPSGWELCDGINGRPNLLGKFPKSIPNSSTTPGTSGGSDTRILTIDTMPAHTHTLSISTDGLHAHTYTHIGWELFNVKASFPGETCWTMVGRVENYMGYGNSAHTHTVSNNTTGSGTSFDIKPSYYEAVYIIKT